MHNLQFLAKISPFSKLGENCQTYEASGIIFEKSGFLLQNVRGVPTKFEAPKIFRIRMKSVKYSKLALVCEVSHIRRFRGRIRNTAISSFKHTEGYQLSNVYKRWWTFESEGSIFETYKFPSALRTKLTPFVCATFEYESRPCVRTSSNSIIHTNTPSNAPIILPFELKSKTPFDCLRTKFDFQSLLFENSSPILYQT